jgi:hypothetical protein
MINHTLTKINGLTAPSRSDWLRATVGLCRFSRPGRGDPHGRRQGGRLMDATSGRAPCKEIQEKKEKSLDCLGFLWPILGFSKGYSESKWKKSIRLKLASRVVV